MPVTSLDGLSKYTSNTLTDEVRDKADSAATDTKFLGTSNLIQNTSNDIMDDVNTKASATDTKFLGTSNLIQNTSNDIMDDVNTKASATNIKFSGTSNLIQNTSNDIMDDVNTKASATNTKFLGTSNLIQNTSNDIMDDVNTKASATNIKFLGTSNLIQDTSNYISDRITELSLDEVANGDQNKFIINDQYDGALTVTQNLTANGEVTFDSNLTVNGDVTLTQTLTVSGNLDINGTTTTVNTAVYTTESLEVVSSSLDSNSPALKVTETGTANIMEVYKDSNNVITVDNSGAVTTTGTINGASPTEMSQLTGVSSSIQTQLNAKQNKLTQAANAGTNVTITDATGKIDVTIPALNGAISEITSADLTVNKALISDGSGKVNVSAVTSTELGYLGGVTSGIQTQIDAKQGTLSSSTDVTVKKLYTTGAIYINNDNPTLYLQDTNGRSSMIHCNANSLYFLRGSGTNSTGWETTNGAWPLVINLDTNRADFGGHVTVKGNITATGTINGVSAAQFTEMASGGGEWKKVLRDDSLPVWNGVAVNTDVAYMYGTTGIYTTVDKLLEQATKHGNIATGDFYIKCRSTYMTGSGTTRTINESKFYLVFYENKLLHYTVVETASLNKNGTHTIKTDFYSTSAAYKTWPVQWYYGNATFSYQRIQTDTTYSYANIKIRTMTQQDPNATDFAIYFIGEPNVDGNELYVS